MFNQLQEISMVEIGTLQKLQRIAKV